MFWLKYTGFALLVLAIIFVAFRVFVRGDYRRKGRLTPFSIAMEYVTILTWVAFSNAYLVSDWPAVHVGLQLQLIGGIFMGAGLLIFLFSLIWLGIGPSHGQKREALMQSGPYKYSRNPQAVGFLWAMLGFLLVWPSWHMVLSVILVTVLAHVMILTEEEYLTGRFGDSYKAYCARVPRYV
jgi:protein-S-isoprenylcysteine O-methyltransferase Ste14